MSTKFSDKIKTRVIEVFENVSYETGTGVTVYSKLVNTVEEAACLEVVGTVEETLLTGRVVSVRGNAPNAVTVKIYGAEGEHPTGTIQSIKLLIGGQ